MPSFVMIRKSMPSPLIESLLIADFMDLVTSSFASSARHCFFVSIFDDADGDFCS